MNMINYLQENPGIFKKIANTEHKGRSAFRVGTVSAQNSTDRTYDVKSTNDTPIEGLNSMSEDKFSQGAPVIYIGGNCRTAHEILTYSPYIVTTQLGQE